MAQGLLGMSNIDNLKGAGGQFSDPEYAKAMSKKGVEARVSRKGEVEKLLLEAGYEDTSKAPETIRQLALSAVKGTAADMRLYLQQTGQLTKGPATDWDGLGNCPTCGLDPAGGLVLEAEDMAGLSRAVERLQEIVGVTELPLPDAPLIASLPDVEDK